MKKKMMLLICTLIGCTMFTMHSARAAALQNELHLNINGVQTGDQKPIVVNNVTLVPIRTVSIIPNVNVDWNSKTKTITVTDSVTKDTLKLTVGSKEAIVGGERVTLKTPPVIRDGAVYVPFRWIGEGIKANVVWDAPTKTVVIYKTSPELLKDSVSADLVKSRNAALDLPRITLQDDLIPDQEGGAGGTYYFQYGKSNSFIYEYRGISTYYKVINGAAWGVWQGKEVLQIGNGFKINMMKPNGEEWGTRPDYSGKVNYFMDLWKMEEVKYGTFDEAGNVIFSASKSFPAGAKNFISEIPGEQS